MVRLALVAMVIGLVLWGLARPARGVAQSALDASWQRKGLRLAVIGLAGLWVAALVAVGVLR